VLTRGAVLTVRAVHFDLDGVLADSRPSILRAWRRWAAERDVAWDALEPHIEGRLAVDTIRAVRPDLDAEQTQADADRVNALQIADEEDATPLPGMVELVRSLDGAPWSVVTGAPRALAAARLARCGYPQPPALVGAEDVRRGKPDPEGYLVAARRIGVPPGESLVVEDSPAGIAAGIAAGAAVLAVTSPAAAARAGDATIVVRDGRDVRFRVAGGAVVVEQVAGSRA